MKPVEEEAQIFLGVLLTAHDGRVAAVLLQGAVDELGGKGLANPVLNGSLPPRADLAVLNHGEFMDELYPSKRRRVHERKSRQTEREKERKSLHVLENRCLFRGEGEVVNLMEEVEERVREEEGLEDDVHKAHVALVHHAPGLNKGRLKGDLEVPDCLH